MASVTREIERKYEAPADTPAAGTPGRDGPPAADDTALLDALTRTDGVDRVREQDTEELDAVYHDTDDGRLAATRTTLRRRTGGHDAGWHLKLPVTTADDARDELHAPLADTVPADLARLLRSRTRGAPLGPVLRLRTTRRRHTLHAADGTTLAEVAADTVRAERLDGAPGGLAGRATAWREIEIELTEAAPADLLDRAEEHLTDAGIRRSHDRSKFARALADTGPPPETEPGPDPAPAPGTAGAEVLAHVARWHRALVALDTDVRRDLPDSVHQLRVAIRRLRGAFRTYRKVLDRAVTEPIGDELKWLASQLAPARDGEVLTARLHHLLDTTDPALVLGPAPARLQLWSTARAAEARDRVHAALDSPRHLALLTALARLATDPPLREAAHRPARKVLPAALARDHRRLATRIDHALALPPGADRDHALHRARKAAKRARYATEAARPALGKPAKRYRKRVKTVQRLLGAHQDSVVTRDALRQLGLQAHGAGESAFTWGLLYGTETARADAAERDLPEAWEAVRAQGPPGAGG
ncbi:CHAD domain-containing protein [Streptomyces sp. NPDC058374]|uniref:CYTH and CHAD domain-containing protein n=1 Tax=unclassified Streptomyces TaxID=2593676 RepID=UPI00364858F7